MVNHTDKFETQAAIKRLWEKVPMGSGEDLNKVITRLEFLESEYRRLGGTDEA